MADLIKEKAFILDIFTGEKNGDSMVYGIGRLESGKIFGFSDNRIRPSYFIPAGSSPGDAVSLQGEPVRKISFQTVREMKNSVRKHKETGTLTFDDQISFTHQYLLDREIGMSVNVEGTYRPSDQVDCAMENPTFSPADWEPSLAVLVLDIETDGEARELLGLSWVFRPHTGRETKQGVMIVGESLRNDPEELTCFPDQRELLIRFIELIRELDPDILTGWNVIDFDLAVLSRIAGRLGVPFNIGRTKGISRYRESEYWGGSRMHAAGRQVLDALHLVRGTSHRFEDFRLETVAEALLEKGKALTYEEWEKVNIIEEAYRNDREAFFNYSLLDSLLVLEILEKEDLITLTISKSLLIGLPLQEVSSSVAPFEYIYRKGLRKRGYIGPSSTKPAQEGRAVAGGLVLKPETGLHQHILVFDFKSLYPSIIRTFNVDPLAMQIAGDDPITAPNGARFHRERGVLPEVVDTFFEKREEAKREGNAAASYAYKIIMNSFYGVLGTSNCIFAAPELAGAITGFGQLILSWTKKYLEEKGFRVLYGDTDSLFADVGFSDTVAPDAAVARGKETAAEVNTSLSRFVEDEYRLESRLELEFEKYYRWFFLPPGREAGGTRSKSYAGLKLAGEERILEITGMEAVRRDWTPAARSLQYTLLQMLFDRSPGQAMETYVADILKRLKQGELDKDLIYTKRIRKPLEAYTKTSPPHVKAARLLPKPAKTVRYLITTEGPQPIGFVRAPIDYDHYIDKQLYPIVNLIALYGGINMSRLFLPRDGQQELF